MARSGRSLLVLFALALTASLLPVTSAAHAGPELNRVDRAAEHLLVGLRPGVAPSTLEGVVSGQRPARVVETIEPLGVGVVEVPEEARARVTAALERNPNVRFVEQDAVVTTASGRIPNDPEWAHQWSPKKTRAPDAWTVTTGSSSTVIAVLDTGVRSDHPDLSGGVLPGRNVIDDDKNTTDRHGHGTASAGVAAARTDNGRGVAGYCWRCSILPVKVLGDDGGGLTSDVAKGIVWATDNGADVISMSLGGSRGTTTLRNAVRYARDRGVLLVGAAGNEGEATSYYPGAYPDVVAVAASDRDDRRYSWSNHGPDVDVAAPGCNRSTTVGGGYGEYCGTSSATPVVAGIAGLLVSANPAATPDALTSALTASAVGVGYVAHGRVDATAAMEVLDLTLPRTDDRTESGDPDPNAPTVIERVAGEDRIRTAIRLARTMFPDGARTVVIARADNYPDALAGAPLANQMGGPILLTGARALPDAVKDEVRRLSPDRVVLLGGSGALSERVRRDAEALGVATVVRYGGDNRYATAARVARALRAAGGDTRHVYVVQGAHADPNRGWPDAVAVAGLAASQGRPILLTRQDALPTATARALLDLGATDVTVVGGTGAVSPAVVTALRALGPLGLNVRRVAGANRYETSSAVAELAASNGSDVSRTWVATGRNFPDALAAGASVAADGGVLLLVDGHDLDRSSSSRDWIREKNGQIRHVRLVGGKGVITEGVREHIERITD